MAALSFRAAALAVPVLALAACGDTSERDARGQLQLSIETLKTTVRDQDGEIAKLREKLEEVAGKLKTPPPAAAPAPAPVVSAPAPVNDEALDRAASELQAALSSKLGSGKSVGASAKLKLVPVIVRDGSRVEKVLPVAFEKNASGKWRALSSVEEILLAVNTPDRIAEQPKQPPREELKPTPPPVPRRDTATTANSDAPDGRNAGATGSDASSGKSATPLFTPAPPVPKPEIKPVPQTVQSGASSAPYWITKDGKRVLVLPQSGSPPSNQGGAPAPSPSPSLSPLKPSQPPSFTPVQPTPPKADRSPPAPSTQTNTPTFRRVPSLGDSTKINLPKAGSGGGDVQGVWKEVEGKKIFVPSGSAK